MARAIATQAFGEPTQDQVPVRFEDHVDEVDDDHSADVPQAHLANDLLGSFKVVTGDGFLEVSAGSGELAGIDVDDSHGLGAVDHQGAARRQPHLAIECLCQLLVDTASREDVDSVVRRVLLEPRKQVGSDGVDVVLDRRVRLLTLDDQLGEVLVEQIANDLDQHVRLFVQCLRGCRTCRCPQRRPAPRCQPTAPADESRRAPTLLR